MALDPEDLPVLSMLMDHTTPADIMSTVGIDHDELNARIHRMLEALKPGAAIAQPAPPALRE